MTLRWRLTPAFVVLRLSGSFASRFLFCAAAAQSRPVFGTPRGDASLLRKSAGQAPRTRCLFLQVLE